MPKSKKMIARLYEMFNKGDFSGINTFELSVQLEYIVKWLVYYLNDFKLAQEFIKGQSNNSNINLSVLVESNNLTNESNSNNLTQHSQIESQLTLSSNIKIRNCCAVIRRVKLNPELVTEYKKHELYQQFESYFSDKCLLIRSIVYYFNQHILSYHVSNAKEINEIYQTDELLTKFNVNHLNIDRSTSKYVYYHYDSSYVNVNISTLEYWMDLIDKPSMVNVIVFMFLTNYVNHDNLKLFKNGLDYKLYFIIPKGLTTNVKDFVYYIALLKKYKEYVKYNTELMNSDQKQRYEHLMKLLK